MNVVKAAVGERGEIAPAEMEPRVERFAVDRAGGPDREQRGSGETAGNLSAGGFDDRGEKIDERRRAALMTRPARARQLDEEWNAYRFAVEKDPVLVLAVLAEPFAVVRQEDDEGAVVEALLLQEPEEGPDDRVGRRDLAVVGTSRVARREGLRRRVGGVRLVEVEDGQEGLSLRESRDPALEKRLGLRAGTLNFPDRPSPAAIPVEWSSTNADTAAPVAYPRADREVARVGWSFDSR